MTHVTADRATEPPATPRSVVETAVARLVEGEKAWARATIGQRRELLAQVRRLTAEHAQEWVERACGIKGLEMSSPLVGEEWISGPYAMISYLDALDETLAALEEGRDPLEGFTARPLAGGRVAVDVLPHTVYDRLLLLGYKATLWSRPGVGLKDLRAGAGLGQRTPEQTHGVCVVLGAGNIMSIAPLDVLYALIADNRVVALKLNPVTDDLAPVFSAIFAPLGDVGAVEVLTGGADVGAALIGHRDVAAIHMTGSGATHDAIVWGHGEEATANKAAGTPLVDKPITSELGGVSPTIVVPGPWSRGDLRRQARNVATMRLHNSGANCIATQVVLVSSEWELKDAFLTELRGALAAAYERPSWYPGCDSRISAAREAYPQAETVAGSEDRTLVAGLDALDGDEVAFHQEYFGPVLVVAEVPGTGQRFLDSAVAVANERLYGTLGANILIHPKTRRRLGTGFERAVSELRYGTIGINVWNALGFLTPRATWGAFPGHPLEDIGSGRGVVHNALLLDGIERTVVEGLWRPLPTPPWFVDNPTAATTGAGLTRFQAEHKLSDLPGIFASALRG